VHARRLLQATAKTYAWRQELIARQALVDEKWCVRYALDTYV
jgi:hypothetical protein